MTAYRYSTITEVSELIRQQKVSPVALVTSCLERIERLNPKLNAFITVTGERALEDARKAEADIQDGKWRGPLHGVPVGVKDFFDTAGVKTTAAFEHFKNRTPSKDAAVVTKLKEAGAIIVGKLNMHTLGMGTTSLVSYFGPVHNPWNQEHIAGGSSGGSSAAVAAGLLYATVDTDAIGSCRLPAAICGVIGFKASYGLISSQGILDGEEGADELILRLGHTAFQCRGVDDAAILLNALTDSKLSAGKFITESRLAFGALESPKIGVATNYTATDEVRMVFQKALETFRSLECAMSAVEAPLSAPFSIERIEEDRKNISESLFKDVDVLILPTATDPTPTIEQAGASGPQAVASANTYFCNYYGLPAISVPCGFDKNGLPLGLQIVGPTWGEAAVLNLAHAFQQATMWHLAHPTL
jgi:aspartyl-tRNA(Asn)/glutamyl-tRNA(Gln) amidotransferase subunit A